MCIQCVFVLNVLCYFFSQLFTLNIILLGPPIFMKISSYTTPLCLLGPHHFMIRKMNKYLNNLNKAFKWTIKEGFQERVLSK